MIIKTLYYMYLGMPRVLYIHEVVGVLSTFLQHFRFSYEFCLL